MANSAFDQAQSGDAVFHIPGLVFAEILYLSERKKIGLTMTEVADFEKQLPGCREYPLTLAVAQSAAQITDIPELHGRLIAGTARLPDLPLITNDSVIRASSFVRTIG